MRNQLLFICFLTGLLVAGKVNAQEQDSVEVYRWGIGLDALSLVDKNSYPDYSVFGRYLLNPDAEKSTFLRLRLGYGYEAVLDTASSGISLDHSSSLLRYALALGVQRDLVLKGKSSLYTGGELSFHDFRYERDWDITDHTGYENTYQQRLSLYGLLGYNYKLTGRLNLSLETSVSVHYKKYHLDEDVFYVSGGSIRENWSEIIQSRFNPFHQLLITYNF